MTQPVDPVLVVDDNEANRDVLSRSLARLGYRVLVAEDGRVALDVLASSDVDLVLLDIMMPVLDGYAVLERRRVDPHLRSIPFIVISATGDDASVIRCIEMGAEDYLPKPFNPVLLRARINAALAKKRLQELERERVRELFSRFVPEHVVDDVLERTDEDLRLGGSRGVGTVMFTDIREFTAFTERTQPDRVIDLLNEYFGEMIEAVFHHGGTLVGYLGDGLLAVFGAPIPLDDHADRALAAAREMVAVRLPRFNRRVRERTLGNGFEMGIGLNSGLFVAGNVGSARRLEYTVYGDTVNTASRIEGMTKITGQSVLIADSTRQALLRPPSDLVHVGEFDVRGKQSGIRLWTV